MALWEQRCGTFDRELLAAFAAVRHFRFLLEVRPFRILTDHMPLTLAMGRVSPIWSSCQVRQMAYISEFTTDLLPRRWSRTPSAARLPCHRHLPAPTMLLVKWPPSPPPNKFLFCCPLCSRPPHSSTLVESAFRIPSISCLCIRVKTCV